MKNLFTVLIVLLAFSLYNTPAQSYLNYYLISSSYNTYFEITDGTLSTATGDDGAENIVLPFPFKYLGVTYNTARISVNGWLEMGQSYTGPGALNQLESTLMKPLICPLWDNLYADSQSEISYKVTGEYPARFFTVQWKNIKWSGNNSRKSFQVRLWELDGSIDLIYGPGNSSSILSYSVGINNHIGGINNFVSITPSQYPYYTPDASTTQANNDIDDLSLLPDDLMYTFRSQVKRAVVYQVPDTINAGAVDQKILAIIVASHEGDILTMTWTTSFVCNTAGTTNPDDILAAKIYYTMSNPSFSTTYLLGTYNNPSGEFTVPATAYLINNNVAYFWLVYDIAPNAAYGNTIDGQCIRINNSNPPIYPDTIMTSAVLVIVPVELVSFTAFQNNSSVELNWITKTELNNSGFEIHRRKSDEQWENLGFVLGSGTTSEPQVYSFNDNDVQQGLYFYRLKQIDYDGSFEYSDIINIDVYGSLTYSLKQNYPNPFNPSTKIFYSVPELTNVSIKVFDALGNDIATILNEEKPSGSYESIWNAGDAPSGVYFYQIKAGQFTETKKMILMR